MPRPQVAEEHTLGSYLRKGSLPNGMRAGRVTTSPAMSTSKASALCFENWRGTDCEERLPRDGAYNHAFSDCSALSSTV